MEWIGAWSGRGARWTLGRELPLTGQYMAYGVITLTQGLRGDVSGDDDRQR